MVVLVGVVCCVNLQFLGVIVLRLLLVVVMLFWLGLWLPLCYFVDVLVILVVGFGFAAVLGLCGF